MIVDDKKKPRWENEKRWHTARKWWSVMDESHTSESGRVYLVQNRTRQFLVCTA